jgi:hypothetical protein
VRILLAPNNESSEKVFECLLGWSRSGLLEPFAWRGTDPGQALGSSAQVLRVEAGESRELLLGAALQGFDESNDELIGFYAATPHEGFDSEFAEAAAACVDLLSRTIAHDSTRPARCTMVVAPSQIAQPVPRGLLSQSFASNVYIAPEDRAEPKDPNRLLGNEAVFPMHAAHAIATVADLWNEPDAGRPSVVDVLARRQPHNQLAIQVVRCFSRGIDFGYLPDHVSAGIFHGGGGWPNPDSERFDRIDDAETVVPFLANDYLDAFSQELGLSKFNPHQLQDPEPLGLLEAFRLLVRLIVMRIRRKPFEVVRQRLDAIHNRAADWVENQAGPDSGIRVKRRGRSEGSVGERIELDAVLEKPLVVPDGPVAEAWTALRRLVLGLVDGSELPDGIDRTRLVNGRRQRALVTQPAVLAPDPDSDPPPVDSEGPICDPMRLDPALAGEESSGEELPEEEAEPAVSDALREWSQPHRSALLWRVGVGLGEALLTARREAQVAPPPDLKEDGDAADGGEEEAASPTSGKERKGLGRRLRRAVLTSTAVAALAIAVAASQLALIGVAAALVAVGILWFLALAGAARRWFLGNEAIGRREDEQELARLNAALKRSLRMGDEIRLARRYREYLDWAEMLARFVHKPWVGDALGRVALSPPLDHATLPAAFSVGVTDISEHELERLSAAAGSGVFNPGWLSGLYETTERLEMTEIGVRRGLPVEQAEVDRDDPATDVGKDREGPRKRLLDAVRRGKHRSLTGSELEKEVLRHLGDMKPDNVCERVVVLPTADGATAGEEIDALPPSLAGFQPPASLAPLVEELSPAVVKVECEPEYRALGGSGVIIGDEGLVATAAGAVDGADSISVSTADGRRLDAQLVRVDRDSDLALLSLEAGGELAGVPVPDSAVVVQGDPVVGIGAASTGKGPARVTWGLVVASERSVKRRGGQGASTRVVQVVYRSGESVAGAPMFGLDGRLLGIHLSPSREDAGDSRNQRVSSVIPLEPLRRLMQGEPVEPGERSGASGAGARSRDPVTKPSTFVEGLTDLDAAPALLRHHWKDAETKNETRETIPSAEEAVVGSDKFSSLAAKLAFQNPLRILVHRVDLVAPSGVAELSSFPGAEQEDLGPDEEMVASEKF